MLIVDKAPPVTRDSNEVTRLHNTGFVILTPETVDFIWRFSSSQSRQVGFPTYLSRGRNMVLFRG